MTAPKRYQDAIDSLVWERDRLREVNGELVAALLALADAVQTGLDAGLILSVNGRRPDIMALAQARAALAKASTE